MGGNVGWDRDPRQGMLAHQGRPAPEHEPVTFLRPPNPPMPRGMKLALWLTGIWVFGVVLVVLAHRFVRNLGCLFDTSEACQVKSEQASTNVTMIGFVLLVVVTVITIVVFELRRDRRR